uniref:Uncharacterized protein n=2 Tax=Avena sativa TaxID=4498 RepID=A0ACD5V6V2_AVESA
MPGSGAGVQAPEASPGRYVRRHDEVPPDDDGCDDVLGGGDARGPGDDPFDIPAKRAPVERLRRWRQAALVLNASRRFRYTLDLKKEEEKEHIRRKIRAHAQVIRAALLFKEAGEKQNGDRELPEIPPRGFGIGEEQLTSMTRDHNFSTLQEYGGVKGLLNLLKTNSEKGIHGDEEDLSCRANAFGANRYPRKKGRSFWATDGYGSMLVTAVGLNTEWGLLMASISEDNNEETPLQVRLNGVATFIGIVGLVVAALVLVVLFARYFTGHTTNSDGTVQFVKGQTSVKNIIFGSIKILTVAVTIVVVAVPEGLPLAVTLTLAYSMRKMMADKALRDSDVHVHWKGAAEIVLALCTNWLDVDGSTHEMTPDEANQFKKYIEDMAEQSLRCVAFAYRNLDMKDIPSEEQRISWQLPDNDLTLIGIVGMKDPCRPGVRDAVELCTNSGVKVRMVTGDNLQTARAIALECGILTDPQASTPVIIEGRVFRAFSDAEREEVADKISVMGRSSPNDKLLLVKALKKNGHVVAVTGDGTNDAPSLHEADIGLSMGIQGTEVAKESSDIIILDDNFASVVKVVRWGRSVYANIQKFIQFQLTVNVAALIINVVAAISSGNLLWVNLIMDTLGALALATEPPTDQLMKRTPVGRREPLVTNIMWRNLFIQAVYQVAVLLTLNFGGRNLLHLTQDTLEHSSKVKNSFIFNTFVLCQVTSYLWPLAFVGKFIPVPQTPLKNLILKCWPKRKKQGAEGPTPPV